MSDEVVVPVDAPEVPADAPAEPKEPKEPKAEAKPVEKKPRTVDDDIEDVFKKSGGLKYKAGGKEKAITSAADLRRLLSRVDGVDHAASETAKEKQEAANIKRQLASIEKMPPSQRIAALESIGIKSSLVREAVEESILSDIEKEKARAGLSERERAMQADLEARDEELSRLRGEHERREHEQAEAERVARVTEIGQRLEKVTVAALQKAKVSPDEVPEYLQAIAERLDRNERLGLGLDEQELADLVVSERETKGATWLKGKAPTDLADLLESQGLAKALMGEFARRIKLKVNGEPVPQRKVINGAQKDETPDEKWSRVRGGFGSLYSGE